jgi:hypothetical protein
LRLEHPEARDQTPIRDDEPIKFYFNGRYKAAEKSALKFADNRLTEMSLDPDVSACELSALVEAEIDLSLNLVFLVARDQPISNDNF